MTLEKSMTYRVRVTNHKKNMQVTMSGRVRTTTDVQLASNSFLAFKLEASVVMEKQVIASWNQS